jgi:hypothetical protein
VGVRFILVLARGEVPRLLKAAGQADGFQLSARLPPDLAPGPGERGQARDSRLWREVTTDGVREPGPDDVPLLLEDPDLALGIPDHLLEAARRDLVGPVRLLPKGSWPTASDADLADSELGVLILEGLVVRRVGRSGRYGAELLGPGDILRVGRHPGEDAAPGFTTLHKVVVPGRVAVLNGEFARRLGEYPAVAGNLISRAMARSHALAVTMAVAHYPRVERRLIVVLWHTAQRWGRVTPEGVVLRLPLTHWILADLTAARRPSVTLAVQQLQNAGMLERRNGEWILLGSPPPDLLPPLRPDDDDTASDAEGPWPAPALAAEI